MNAWLVGAMFAGLTGMVIGSPANGGPPRWVRRTLLAVAVGLLVTGAFW